VSRDRRGPLAWHASRAEELLELLARNQELSRRVRSMQLELQAKKREFWSRWIEIAPVEGYRCGEALTSTVITKRGSSMPTVALPIVNYENLAAGGWLITCEGAVTGLARKALEKLGPRVLAQMHNKGLGAAGEVRSARVENGIARLICRIGEQAEVVARARSKTDYRARATTVRFSSRET
jgi:hypothetical protein